MESLGCAGMFQDLSQVHAILFAGRAVAQPLNLQAKPAAGLVFAADGHVTLAGSHRRGQFAVTADGPDSRPAFPFPGSAC